MRFILSPFRLEFDQTNLTSTSSSQKISDTIFLRLYGHRLEFIQLEGTLKRICGIVGWLLLQGSFTLTPTVLALEPGPHPFDSFLQHILNFEKPTGIRGTLRYIEQEEEIIWLNWEERSDDRPLFSHGWKMVPGEATLAVHPGDKKQFANLKVLALGTPLQLIIQKDTTGHRRILSWHDRRTSPKTPI